MRRLLLSECAFNRFDDCYAHILALTPFFRLVHISLALPLYVCTCVFAQAGRRFYIPALITLVPLKTLCILFKLDEFRFFFIYYSSSDFILYVQCSAIIGCWSFFHFGCVHCFHSLYRTDCMLCK